VTDDLGFAVPVSRRDLAALRGALEDLTTGTPVTATFRTAEHGRFTVSGRVRRDLTDTTFKVGWWDLTTGKGTDPVADLQRLVEASADDEDPQTGEDELRAAVDGLADGDVVTAGFDFEGCGPFTISGGVRRDESGTVWVVAGHFVAHGDVPAPRLRHLVVHR
jgi:hypothetical protein